MSRHLALTLTLLLCISSIKAQVNNIEDAKRLAKSENKLILIKFSGSDWCAPCIAFKKAIFDNPDFEAYAKEKLVLLVADFPRQKKNQLSKEQQAENDKLAEKYNPDGAFPVLLLIDSEGNVLKIWNGYDKKLGVENYIEQINKYTDHSK